MQMLNDWLKRLAMPIGILLIFSSCFVLGWSMYSTVYQPLFQNEPQVISANDYAVPTTKLNNTIEVLKDRSTATVDFSTVPNRFTPAQAE